MAKESLNTLPVEEQAAYWVGELENEPTPETYAAFDEWMAASPTHVTTFAQAQELDGHVRELIHMKAIDVDALVERARQEYRSDKRRMRRKRIAAALAILTAGVAALAHLLRHAG